MICKKCKGEIDKKAVVCVHCGCKVKKPFYLKWWFWGIVAILVIAISSNSGNKTDVDSPQVSDDVSKTEESVVTYETVDLQVMFKDLNDNAMKAEKNYQGKNIEFDAKINSFDSDGSYISVEPVNADEWNFETATCYIKTDEQKNVLIEKSVGDVVHIKGKVTSIGEVLGYSIDIKEVK